MHKQRYPCDSFLSTLTLEGILSHRPLYTAWAVPIYTLRTITELLVFLATIKEKKVIYLLWLDILLRPKLLYVWRQQELGATPLHH